MPAAISSQPAQERKLNSVTAAKPGSLIRFYTRQALFQLFMICAFPLHLWALLMAFRDFGWVAARTYVWDAVGLVAYTMTFTLFETAGVFLLTLLLGLLLPGRWEINKRVALLGTLFLVLAAWAIVAQLLSAYWNPVPLWVVNSLKGLDHPLRWIWGIGIALVAASVAAPALLVLRREAAQKAVSSAFERIVVLSSFYVFLDVIGVVIIVVRNLLLRLGA